MPNHCTRCGQTAEVSLFCQRLNKDGSIYQRYVCKPCRRNRYRTQKGLHYVEPHQSLEEIIAKGIESNKRLMQKYAKHAY